MVYGNHFNWLGFFGVGSTSMRESLENGVEMYDKVMRQGVRPSTPVILSALKVCTTSMDLKTGRRIHAEIFQARDEGNSYVANTLVSMYAKCGSMDEARQVFDRMKRRTVVSWNTIILGYAEAGQGELALNMFSRMMEEQDSCSPNRVTYLAALKACANLALSEEGRQIDGNILKVESLEQGRSIHSQLSGTELELHRYVASTLVDMYGKCGSMSEARSVFDRMKYRDVVSWTSIILGYAESGDGNSAFLMFSQMLEGGVEPNSVTYLAVLKACVKLPAKECLRTGKSMHLEILKAGKETELYLANALVDMYGKCGNSVVAKCFFDGMQNPNTVSWNALVMGYVEGGNGEQALDMYMQMQNEGCAPDVVSFLGALKACVNLAGCEDETIRNKCLDRGREIHSHLKKTGQEKHVFVASMLVDFYGKCGSLIEAREVFNGMEKPDVLSWTAMISGYVQGGENELALELFTKLQREGTLIRPNSVTYVAALTACGNSGNLKTGKFIHAEICRGGMGETLELPVATAVIEMYGKCGSVDEAEIVFNSVASADVMALNALISAFSRQGNSGRVFAMVRMMVEKDGLKPSEATFVSVLSCCGHSGLVDEGKRWFRMMVGEFRVRPSAEHYSCMVDLLGRANRLDEAVELVKVGRSFGLKDSVRIWMAILSGCRKWGNVSVGRIAFEEIVKLSENRGAAFVLMANIFTQTGTKNI